VGIAFEQDADEDFIKEFLPYADFVQFMGIAKIGFQGQPFDQNVLHQIHWLKRELPNMPIAVDGGINRDTAQLVVDAGATKVVVGHDILESSNPLEEVRELRSIA
jgi:ribulose-phosphate 3-epimerase